ncbi:hypothetical protein GCM10023116_15470 [Kistimonas scapharcae]|uniref:Uncharacterized protein n=1 Tax=Kistimonas scapharcae TaxID=1036133 RepID=A0ABP8UZB4_9GAMM
MSHDKDEPDLKTPTGLKKCKHAIATAIRPVADNRSLQMMRQEHSAQKIINVSAHVIYLESKEIEAKQREVSPDYVHPTANMPSAIERAASRYKDRCSSIEGDKHYTKVKEIIDGEGVPVTPPSGDPVINQ